LYLDIDSHFFDKKHILNTVNAQGLECLGDKNELFIIDDDGLGGMLYKFRPFVKIASFQNNYKKSQSEISFMAHPTSLVKIENTGIVVNSQQRVAPKIAIYDYEKHLIEKYLNDNVIHNVVQKPDYAGLKIELVNFNDDKYILLAGNKINSTLGKNVSVIEFINKDDLTSICEINVPYSQNMFWNKDTEELVLSRNVLGYRGSKITKIKFSNQELLKKQICPNFEISQPTFFLILKELEGFSQCGNFEYFLYVDGTLYERNTKFN